MLLIISVYNFNQTFLHGAKFNNSDKDNDGCYADSSGKHCKIAQKGDNYKCTYFQPTNQLPKTAISGQDFLISNKSVPVSTHVHGLEVRPVFDGNPMSWFSSTPQGNKYGTGFQSLSLNSEYFQAFNNSIVKKVEPNIAQYTFKLNRYQNFQPPGNLWYHDHSMHTTQYNVKLGLAGDYIIYDPQVEDQLPDGKYEIFIVAGQNFHRTDGSMDEKKRLHGLKTNPANSHFRTQTGLSLQRNQTYRIRLLNGQFDSYFQNLKFYSQCPDQTKHNIDFSKCKVMNFTVIGSDSSLFHYPVTNVSSLNIASAERFEILITFDGSNAKGQTQNPIAKSSTKVFLAVGNPNQPNPDKKQVNFKLNYTLTQFTGSKAYPRLPAQVKQLVGVTFYDLKPITRLCNPKQNSTLCLSTIRMRPFFADKQFNFYFNGHYDFSNTGASDNPKIGTTQDWMLINTMFFRHPIHVHLINYQVIAKATLKTITFKKREGQRNDPICSFYEMDFYLSAGVIPQGNRTNYQEICHYVRAINITDENVSRSLNTDAYREDKINDVTKISGFDAFVVLPDEEKTWYKDNRTDNTLCPQNQNQTPQQKQYRENHKYVCWPLSGENIPDWYKGWKEVVVVQAFQIVQVRIRWTSTEYNTPKMPKPYPYFNVPEDQLIEYPGYVYHCHILDHEDNQLMRSIMMQPSDQFDKYYKIEDLPDSKFKQCMAGKNNSAGWSARYECVNYHVGC